MPPAPVPTRPSTAAPKRFARRHVGDVPSSLGLATTSKSEVAGEKTGAQTSATATWDDLALRQANKCMDLATSIFAVDDSSETVLARNGSKNTSDEEALNEGAFDVVCSSDATDEGSGLVARNCAPDHSFTHFVREGGRRIEQLQSNFGVDERVNVLSNVASNLWGRLPKAKADTEESKTSMRANETEARHTEENRRTFEKQAYMQFDETVDRVKVCTSRVEKRIRCRGLMHEQTVASPQAVAEEDEEASLSFQLKTILSQEDLEQRILYNKELREQLDKMIRDEREALATMEQRRLEALTVIVPAKHQECATLQEQVQIAKRKLRYYGFSLAKLRAADPVIRKFEEASEFASDILKLVDGSGVISFTELQVFVGPNHPNLGGFAKWLLMDRGKNFRRFGKAQGGALCSADLHKALLEFLSEDNADIIRENNLRRPVRRIASKDRFNSDDEEQADLMLQDLKFTLRTTEAEDILSLRPEVVCLRQEVSKLKTVNKELTEKVGVLEYQEVEALALLDLLHNSTGPVASTSCTFNQQHQEEQLRIYRETRELEHQLDELRAVTDRMQGGLKKLATAKQEICELIEHAVQHWLSDESKANELGTHHGDEEVGVRWSKLEAPPGGWERFADSAWKEAQCCKEACMRFLWHDAVGVEATVADISTWVSAVDDEGDMKHVQDTVSIKRLRGLLEQCNRNVQKSFPTAAWSSARRCSHEEKIEASLAAERRRSDQSASEAVSQDAHSFMSQDVSKGTPTPLRQRRRYSVLHVERQDAKEQVSIEEVLADVQRYADEALRLQEQHARIREENDRRRAQASVVKRQTPLRRRARTEPINTACDKDTGMVLSPKLFKTTKSGGGTFVRRVFSSRRPSIASPLMSREASKESSAAC
eukprot:TRINITY_DN73652_c0_g1_i1.p1 TRINITY_DN73652_c0_g1~~TRINITY_DN73652_c0_g1_i1.p1  ORF type:complete len:896 (+),score=177.30 TRINITY_DN73652_c0_g1_i1:34-2688(+)